MTTTLQLFADLMCARAEEKITDADLQDLLDRAESRNQILTRIHAGAEIAATSGYETIARATDIFTGYLDPDFVRWNTDERGVATGPAKADVYEMDRKDATFREMFTSLGDPESLVLSQGQIIDFCKRHRDLLRQDGYATFFLFKAHGELFVAGVDVGGGKLLAYVRRFGLGSRWCADYRPRVVVPQQ